MSGTTSDWPIGSVLGRSTQLFGQNLQLRMTDIYTQETYTSAINIHICIYIYVYRRERAQVLGRCVTLNEALDRQHIPRHHQHTQS